MDTVYILQQKTLKITFCGGCGLAREPNGRVSPKLRNNRDISGTKRPIRTAFHPDPTADRAWIPRDHVREAADEP